MHLRPEQYERALSNEQKCYQKAAGQRVQSILHSENLGQSAEAAMSTHLKPFWH